MRTLIEIPGGHPLEIKGFEILRERKGVLKDKSEIFIRTLRYLLNTSKPITGDDKMEYIALLQLNGSVDIYLRRKPEIKAFPRDEIDLSVLGIFIGSFNAQRVVKYSGNKKKQTAEWIEKTIAQGCMEKAQVFIKQLSIRV